jgi:hypothetical protein
MHTEAWKQKLAGRGKWATEAGKQKQAGRQAGRQTEAGKDRCSQGKVGRQRQAFTSRKAEAGMQALIDAAAEGRQRLAERSKYTCYNFFFCKKCIAHCTD